MFYPLLTSPVTIRADLTPAEHKIESLLLKKRRNLIENGHDQSSIKIRAHSLFLNGRLQGSVMNSAHQLHLAEFIPNLNQHSNGATHLATNHSVDNQDSNDTSDHSTSSNWLDPSFSVNTLTNLQPTVQRARFNNFSLSVSSSKPVHDYHASSFHACSIATTTPITSPPVPCNSCKSTTTVPTASTTPCNTCTTLSVLYYNARSVTVFLNLMNYVQLLR